MPWIEPGTRYRARLAVARMGTWTPLPGCGGVVFQGCSEEHHPRSALTTDHPGTPAVAHTPLA